MYIKPKDLYKNFKNTDVERESVKHYYLEYFCNNMTFDQFCKIYNIDFKTADWILSKGKRMLLK